MKMLSMIGVALFVFGFSGQVYAQELTLESLYEMFQEMKASVTENELKLETVADKAKVRPGFFFDYTFYRVSAESGGGDFLIRDEHDDSQRVTGDQYYVPYKRSTGGEYTIGIANADGSGLALSYFSTDGSGDTGMIAVSPGGSLWGTRLHPNAYIDDNDVDYASALSHYSYYNFAINGWQQVHTTGKGTAKWVVGVRNARLEHKTNISYVQDPSPIVDRVDNSSEYNKLQGTGLRLGFETMLPLDKKSSLSLKIGGAGSLLRCRRSFQAFEEDGSIFTDGTPTTVRPRIDIRTDSQKTNVTVFDFTAGITYAKPKKSGSHFEVTLGYRYESWKDAIQEMRFNDDVDGQLGATTTYDMSFSGAFLKATMRF